MTGFARVPPGGRFAAKTSAEAEMSLFDLDFFDDTDLVDLADDEPAPVPPVTPAPALAPPVPAEPHDDGAVPVLDPAVVIRARQAVEALRAEEGATMYPKTVIEAEEALRALGTELAPIIEARAVQAYEDIQEMDEARRLAAVEVLSKLRPLGLAPEETLATVDSHRPAAKLLAETSAHFPAEWLSASQALDRPIRARVSSHRSHYVDAKSYWGDESETPVESRMWARAGEPPPEARQVNRSDDGSVSWVETRMSKRRVRLRAAEMTVPSPNTRPYEAAQTATHELTHRMEDANPHLGRLERAFLARRCVQPGGAASPLRSWRRNERVREGGFVHAYVGKEYPSVKYREVLSVGSEGVFHGAYGGLAEDPDHRAFVLGCWAETGRPLWASSMPTESEFRVPASPGPTQAWRHFGPDG